MLTDRATFEGWARALSGLVLPPDLLPPDLQSADLPSVESAKSLPGRSLPVPPVVAASLALHGCAEIVVMLRITMPDGDATGCFGLSGDLAAGLVRCGEDVEIGLFEIGELIDQVIRLVPVAPPPPLEAASGCVRITVMGPDATVGGWQQILLAGERHWRRMQSGAEPHRLVAVSDVHGELAADLRFVLAGCLAGGNRV
ncbi:MAG TPA: hypothetical protein VLL08_08560 [Kineosporiaceae bacterium]|nr:hypothetical protein [Kineosporiaceae bacterium]